MNEMKKSIWTRDYILFLILACFFYMNSFMLNPVIASYTKELGGNANDIGLTGGIMSAAALILTPIGGPIVDRWNRKRLALASTALILFANILYYTATHVSIFILARGIQGVGFAFACILLSTAASTMFSDEIVGKAVGIFSAVQAASQALAPSIGLFIRDHFGNRNVFILTTTLMVFCLLLIPGVQNFGCVSDKKRSFSFRPKDILLIHMLPTTVTCFIAGFLIHVLTSYLDPVTRALGSTSGMGIFFTIYASALLLTRGFLSPVLDRTTLGKVVLICCPLGSIAMILLQLQQSALLLFLGGILFAAGVGTLQTMSQVALVKSVDSSRRGIANSTYYIGMHAGHALGGYCGGLLLQDSLMNTYFFYFAAICLIPLAAAFLSPRQYFHQNR